MTSIASLRPALLALCLAATLLGGCERRPQGKSTEAASHAPPREAPFQPPSPPHRSPQPSSSSVDQGVWLGEEWMQFDASRDDDVLLESMLRRLTERPDPPIRLVSAFQPEGVLRSAREVIARMRASGSPEEAERMIPGLRMTPNVVIAALRAGIPRPTAEQFSQVLQADQAALGESDALRDNESWLRRLAARLEVDAPVSLTIDGEPEVVSRSEWQLTTSTCTRVRVGNETEVAVVLRTFLRTSDGEVRLVCSTVSCLSSDWRDSLGRCLRAHGRLVGDSQAEAAPDLEPKDGPL